MIFCKKCGAPIGLRSSTLGDKIPKKWRDKLKPVNVDGLDERLCADCEEKVRGAAET